MLCSIVSHNNTLCHNWTEKITVAALRTHELVAMCFTTTALLPV